MLLEWPSETLSSIFLKKESEKQYTGSNVSSTELVNERLTSFVIASDSLIQLLLYSH